MGDLGECGHAASGTDMLPSAAQVDAFTARLIQGAGAGMTDAERIDFLRAAEVLKSPDRVPGARRSGEGRSGSRK